jgi:hypothetical protein
MTSISQWQQLLKEAADARFPNNTSGTFDRVKSLQDQLDDIKAAIAVENGELESDDHAHQDADHRIAALIADALIFAEERGVSVEPKLESVLAWFRETTKKSE